MTKAKLQTTLIGILTAIPISLDLITKGRLLKTNNPYPNAMKLVTVSGMIGADYGNVANNQLGREGKDLDFFAQDHLWMVRAERNLGKNKNKDDGKRYLPMKVQSASKAVYLDNGIDVTDAIQAFIRKTSAPKTQANLDTKVIWRTPEIASIHKARLLGAEHTING
tara:strand:+ start:1502 stop:1999 length:498 start_codon:yes stop_codon:yes gene_type:complete